MRARAAVLTCAGYQGATVLSVCGGRGGFKAMRAAPARSGSPHSRSAGGVRPGHLEWACNVGGVGCILRRQTVLAAHCALCA